MSLTDPVHRLDLAALEAWLRSHLPEFSGPLVVEKIPHGQSNPTYRLTTPRQRLVLRCKPWGMLLKSAHAIEREFRVQGALASTEVPVARMQILCEDTDILGSAFYVMSYVSGQTYVDPRLPGFDPVRRRCLYGHLNAVLAAIHDVDYGSIGLADYGPAGDYYRRQFLRWSKQYEATATEKQPDMDALMEWLWEHMPDDDGLRSLVHGDFRLDNLLFSSSDDSCAAVMDWELSTLGHPFADLAGLLMQWRMPVGEEGRGLAGVDREALGIPSDVAFIESYVSRRGLVSISRLNFYIAFCFFRMGAILQGVKKRSLEGNGSNPERGLRMGEYVPLYISGGLLATREDG